MHIINFSNFTIIPLIKKEQEMHGLCMTVLQIKRRLYHNEYKVTKTPENIAEKVIYISLKERGVGGLL